MDAEFTEREFEIPLYRELPADGLIYTPDSIFEKVVGHDCALRCTSRHFWERFGLLPPSGRVPAPSWWAPLTLEQEAQVSRHVYNKPLNLFLQCKRPSRERGAKSKAFALFGGPYYEYSITPHQHIALTKCAAALQSDGLVAYASPCFYTQTALESFAEQHALADNTHFVEVDQLDGHLHFAYDNPNKSGWAFSTPRTVPALELLKDVRYRGEGRNRDPLDPSPERFGLDWPTAVRTARLAIGRSFASEVDQRRVGGMVEAIEKECGIGPEPFALLLNDLLWIRGWTAMYGCLWFVSI